MRLQADHAVDDVRAGLLQMLRPLDVVRLVEARLDFDDGGDLLAVDRRLAQRRDDGRVAARAVQRDLDREHLRIARGALHQFDDRLEAVVGVMQEHVALAQRLEDVRRRGRPSLKIGTNGRSFSRAKASLAKSGSRCVMLSGPRTL